MNINFVKDKEIQKFTELIELYQNIFNGLTCGIWVSNRFDEIIYANKAMEMIAGVTHQKLIGYRILTDYSENTMDYFRQYYVEAKVKLTPIHYSEIPVITPAGRETYQSGWFIPRVKDNQYYGMICILEDITAHKAIKKALRESRAKYQEIVENVNSIIMRISPEGKITFLNTYAIRFFGFEKDEILNKNIFETIIPGEKRLVNRFNDMLKNINLYPEQYAQWEFENIRKDGERVWISWTNKAILDQDGRVFEILCVGNDITELKRNEALLRECRNDLEKKVKERTAQLEKANELLKQEIYEHKWLQEKLKNSEYKYRILFENANIGIVIIQDKMCKFLNPKAEKITGYTKEELMMYPIFDLIVHPYDKNKVMEWFLKSLRGESLYGVFSFRIVDKNGFIKWIETNSILIDWMGRPGMLVFFSNITDRKRSEEHLKLLESAFQQSNDSIIITTAVPNHPSSKIVFVNSAFTKMTGYSEDEVKANPSLILQGPYDNRSEWIKLENSKTGNKSFYIETINYKKDGSKLNLAWQIFPIKDERGRISHFVSIQRDITEQKKAERELIKHQKQLRALASQLSLAEERERRRIAILLHDNIAQTLAIAKIKLGILETSISKEDTHRLLKEIRDLVDTSLNHCKSLTFELSPPILYELGLESAIEWLGEQIESQHNIKFIFETKNLSHKNIHRDIKKDIKILLYQVVKELCINIIKHAEANKIKIYFKKYNDKIEIDVEDDGKGFDPTQLNKSNSFGIFSIKERLSHYGGYFSINSSPGKGTKISLSLTIHDEA